jgi:ribonuclease T2
MKRLLKKDRLSKLAVFIAVIVVFMAARFYDTTAAPGARIVVGKGGAASFDYYALVLSWSPTYCSTPQGKKAKLQCGVGRKRDYGFVVHGLWPQYKKGWPQNCPTGEKWVSKGQIAAMLDIMPSPKLVIHEWKKHGTCSDLGQTAYFATTRELYNKLKIPKQYISPGQYTTTSPEDLKRQFMRANSWLQPEMISVQCGNRRDRATLRDLRFCFGTDLKPRACGQNERQQCKASRLIMPPAR